MADKYELGTAGPIPTVNPRVAKLADMLKAAKSYANQYYVKENVPVLGGTQLGDFLLGQAPEEMTRWGEGNYPVRNPSEVVGTGGNRADIWKAGRFEPTFDVATALPITGAAKATKGMPIGAMMIGPESKLWKREMEFAARKLEAKGADPVQIRDATGLVRGLDKEWRTEISDKFSKMKGEGAFGDMHRRASLNGIWMKDKTFINDIYEHPELEKAYPQFFDKTSDEAIQIKAAPKDARYMGRVEDGGKTIAIREDATPDEARQIINHELMHVIQKKEGWNLGGSPDSYTQQQDAKIAQQALAIRGEAEKMSDNVNWHKRVEGSYVLHKGLGMDFEPEALKVAENRIMNPTQDLENLTNLYGSDRRLNPDTPREMYQRIAGEAEARLVENRMNLSDEELMKHFPYRFEQRKFDENYNRLPIYGLDIKPEEAIVHGREPGVIEVGGKRVLGEQESMRPESADYRGEHKAPTRNDYNAPAHELNKIYPDDIYGPKGHQYYGHGEGQMDKDTMQILNELRGNPDANLVVYRAVPNSVSDLEINPGDWITPNLDYAHMHGARFEDGYRILERKVPARHIYTDANSIHEFGYDPTE